MVKTNPAENVFKNNSNKKQKAKNDRTKNANKIHFLN